MVKVLFFSQTAQLAGTSAAQWPLVSPCDACAFWESLLKKYPALAHIHSACRLARNGEYLREGEKIHPGDEIAVIPPVSGG